MNVKYIYMWTQ